MTCGLLVRCLLTILQVSSQLESSASQKLPFESFVKSLLRKYSEVGHAAKRWNYLLGSEPFSILLHGRNGLEDGLIEDVCGYHIFMKRELGAVLDSGF
jgi:hypothetical protein